MTIQDDDTNGTPELRATVPPAKTAGVSGTPIFNGFVGIVEDNKDLIGERKYKTYGELLANLSICAAGVRFFLNLLSQPGWRAEPANESAEAKRIAELVTNMMGDMRTPWYRVVRRAAMYRFYGFSVQEWTAKMRPDGVIGMSDVQPRPQQTIQQWDADKTGVIKGIVQWSPHDGSTIYLPRSKVIYLVDDSLTDSPEGLGLLRHVAEPARILRRYQQLEGWGFECDLRGIPLGRAPLKELQDQVDNEKITAEQRDQIIDPLKRFLESHIKNPKLGMMLDSRVYATQDEAERPSGVKEWDLELLKADGGSHADIARAIERLRREIAQVLGVEHILLGDNGVGSFAMSKDKSQNFALIVDGTMRDITVAITSDWLDRIMELNGWDKTLRPTLKCDKLQYRSIEQITGALRDMAQAGAVLAPDDPAIFELRDMLGLSRPTTVLSALEMSLQAQQEKANNSSNGDPKPQ